MVVEENDLQLIEILSDLEKEKFSQAEKDIVLGYINNDVNNYLNIVAKVIALYEGEEDAVKKCGAKYTALGLDKYLRFKFIKGYLDYVFNSEQKIPEKKLTMLKSLYETNKDCPNINIKNGILLSIARYLVVFGGVAKDSEFIKEIMQQVKSMSTEEIQNAVTVR